MPVFRRLGVSPALGLRLDCVVMGTRGEEPPCESSGSWGYWGYQGPMPVPHHPESRGTCVTHGSLHPAGGQSRGEGDPVGL